VAGSELDFTSGRRIGPTKLDTAFTALRRDDDGLVRVQLDDTETGRRATVWMDEHFGYVMAFTATPWNRPAAAVSRWPSSHDLSPDALRSGTDLVRLEPGASWQASWGISPG